MTWTYHPQLLATPVPRYTSFPTAAEFTPQVKADRFRQALATASGDVSLYVHIPFCRKICWYCGCNTAAANRAQRLASYLDALHAEIALVASLLPADARVRRIAFGGGSPNALAPDEFVRLFEVLGRHMPLADPLVSVELDPRTLTPQWGPVLHAVGATHASLGVQTFSAALQERIGRVQPPGMIDESVRIVREAGVGSLNFDLMYGLPGQSMEELFDALDRAQEYGADRIALFGYAHVPHLLMRQRRIDETLLPDARTRFAMAAAGFVRLTDGGYAPVGFDHFALPGDPLAQAALAGSLRRNFQGFTEDQAPVLVGLGASAISSFPDLLVQNEKNTGRYRMRLSQGRLATMAGALRSEDDRRRGAVITDLLCRGRARAGRDLLAECMDRLAPYLDVDLAKLEGDTIVVAHHALPYARSIAAAFDPHRHHSPRRFSSAV